jgi:hypothetical protein
MSAADAHFDIPTNTISGVSDAQAQLDFAYHSAISASRFPGPNYFANLQLIHDHLKAETYLEIGVAGAGSLRMAGYDCFAIGIDPGFTISTSIKAWTKLFYLPSDDYFAQHDTREILGGRPVALSFIDGLHTFDQVFRDLLNVMPYLATSSHVILHDVYPVHALPAERERHSIFWTGDVWKVLFLIKEFLPELQFTTIPTAPSGLLLLKGFDGKKPEIDGQKLSDRVGELLQEKYDDHSPDLPKRLNLGLNSAEYIREWLDTPAEK